ncbi:hypothetical protein ABPG74_000141 [Tetrahymena malaccensis]
MQSVKEKIGKVMNFFKRQFTMPIENLIKFLFERFLKTYVKNECIDFNQFYKEGLKDIQLNESLLNDLLFQNSPFKINKAIINNVSSIINWQNILDKSAIVKIQGLNIHISVQNFDRQSFLAKKYQQARDNNQQGDTNAIIEEQDLEDSIKQSVRESLNSFKSQKESSENMYEQVDAYKVLVKKLLLGLKLQITDLNIFLEIPETSTEEKQKNTGKSENNFLLFHLESFQLQQFHDKQESKSFIKQVLFSNFETKAHGLQIYLTQVCEIPQNNIESNQCIMCCGHEYEYNAQLNQYIPKQQLRISLQKQNIQAIIPRLEIMIDTKQCQQLITIVKSIQQYKNDEKIMEQIYQNQQKQSEKITLASKIQEAVAPPRMRVYSFDYQEMANQVSKKQKILELKKRKSSQKQASIKNQELAELQLGFKEHCSFSQHSDQSESEQIIGDDDNKSEELDDGWSDIDLALDEQEEKIEDDLNGDKQIEKNKNLRQKQQNGKIDSEEEEEVNCQSSNDEKDCDDSEQENKIIQDYFTKQFKLKYEEKIQNKFNDQNPSSNQDIYGIKEDNSNEDDLQKDLFQTLQFNESQLSDILESMRKNNQDQQKTDQVEEEQNNYGASKQVNLESSILVKEEIKNLNSEAIQGIKQDSSHHFLLQSIHIYLLKSSQSEILKNRKWIYSRKRDGDEKMQESVKYNIYLKQISLFQINVSTLNIVQYKDQGNSMHLYFRKAKIFDLNWINVNTQQSNQSVLKKTEKRKQSTDRTPFSHYCIKQIFKLKTEFSKKESSIKMFRDEGYSICKKRIENSQKISQSKICFNLLSNTQKNSVLIEVALVSFNADYKTLIDLQQFLSEIKIQEKYLDEGYLQQNQTIGIENQKVGVSQSEKLKCDDYIKDDDQKQQDLDQVKMSQSKISIQIESLSFHYQIIDYNFLREAQSKYSCIKENHPNSFYCYCSQRQKNQRLSRCPSLFIDLDLLKIIHTTNTYQMSSQDKQVPYYNIFRQEINFNELQIYMVTESQQFSFIGIQGDKNLSCDPFICIETIKKDQLLKREENLNKLNHQESFNSINYETDCQNNYFSQILKNSNLLLFSSNDLSEDKNQSDASDSINSEMLFFQKDKIYVLNVDEDPLQKSNFKNEKKKQKNSPEKSAISCNTEILMSIPNIKIDLKKEFIEDFVLLLTYIHHETVFYNQQKQEYLKNNQNQNQNQKQEQDQEQNKFIFNLYSNNFILTYFTSEKDKIIIEINSIKSKYNLLENQFKCSIYDLIVLDTQQQKPILGQPLRLVESTKITSKYRQYQVQDFILYKQGVYTQHQQFSLGKQPIRVSIQRILSTSNDEEKMNSSYYFAQRMIMIPKSYDKFEKIQQKDKDDQSDWMIKVELNGNSQEYDFSLFGCVFRLTDFSLPFLDEIQFLLENIADMVNQIDQEQKEKYKNDKQIQVQQQQQNINQKINFNLKIQNSAIDIFLYFNQNYLEKGGLSRMSFSHQVIDLELKKNNYYSSNRLCLLIPDCNFSIEQTSNCFDTQTLKIENVCQLQQQQQMNQHKNKVVMNGYLQQFSGYFLQFDDHIERLNSILLLDYSQSIVLATEESLLKQMNFKQIFNVHSVGLKASISSQNSSIQIEKRGVQILLCKDTIKYLINFNHLLQYNLEILGEAANRRKKIAETYLLAQQQKQYQYSKQNLKSLDHPHYEIIEDQLNQQIYQIDLNSSQDQISLSQAGQFKKEVANTKSKRINFTNSRSVFRTHTRLINTMEEEDMNILEAEKTFFTQDGIDQYNSFIHQETANVKFSFSMNLDDFQINIFKGLDFNYDVTCSIENVYRDPLKRNMKIGQQNQMNILNSSSNKQFLSQIQNSIQKETKQLQSLKDSKIFQIIDNYTPQYAKFQLKREDYRNLQKENTRDYKNRMIVFLKDAQFKTEEYIQVSLSQQISQKQDENTVNVNQNQIKKKVILKVKKFEIIDDLKKSSIKKFMTQKKKKLEIKNNQQNLMSQLMSSSAAEGIQNQLKFQNNQSKQIQFEIEQETGIDFLNLEIDVLEESQEHIKVQGGMSIHPLQFFIHGVTLDFLIDFFDLKSEILSSLSGNKDLQSQNDSNKNQNVPKRKLSAKKKNIAKKIKNEWEIVDGDDNDELEGNNGEKKQFSDVEQYDDYQSSDESDEENKELIFDNNISLLNYYYQKNNINNSSPKKVNNSIFSGIQDINPFQLYKNKYSFETFDTKKLQNQQVQDQNIPDNFNKTCIEFTSTQTSQNVHKKDSQLNLKLNNQPATFSSDKKKDNTSNTQQKMQEISLNLKKQSSSLSDDYQNCNKSRQKESDQNQEDDEFDDELDNISFSSIQTNNQKYRIEIDNFEVKETDISIDYDPRAIDLFQLINEFKLEALNISSIQGMNFSLPSLYINKKNFNSIHNILQIAVNTYQKDILENQFSYLDLVQKVNLLKSTAKMFSSIFDIVTIPFEKYQAQETIAEGTLQGTKTVAKMISFQALNISTSILSTVNSTFQLFGIKSRPTRFLTQIFNSIKKQVEDEEENQDDNLDKYKLSKS